MNGWYDHSWSPAAWLAMGLMMLAFWGLIAVLVVYAVRNLGHRPVEDLRDRPVPADQALRSTSSSSRPDRRRGSRSPPGR